MVELLFHVIAILVVGWLALVILDVLHIEYDKTDVAKEEDEDDNE